MTNMFDITQGRSTGMQVQAISRSGTNDLRGSTYGFFRSDSLNAADPVTGRCCPSRTSRPASRSAARSSRTGCTSSASYEYERQPATAVLAPTRLPNQTFQFPSKPINENYLGRVDYQQVVDGQRVGPRRSVGRSTNPFAISSGTSHPSTAED